MSGICGLVLTDRGGPILTQGVGRMAHGLAAGGERRVLVEATSRAALAACPFGKREADTARMATADGDLLLAFHGSLYEEPAVCPAEAGKPGRASRLLELYLAAGLDFLPRLRGEFAMALWDGRRRTAHVATDRFRVHPIFYYHDSKALVFASRMAGLLLSPYPLDLEIDATAIADVVGSSFVPTPRTVFRTVKKLPPGRCLTVFADGRLEESAYWEPSFLDPSAKSRRQLARETRERFEEAVSIRLRYDGDPSRIGAFLSGGVDSSTVTGVLSALTGGPVKTFSIGFEEAPFNEIGYARVTARAFRTDHHEYVVTARDAFETIPTLLDAFDEPYANASAVPTYFCARSAREQGVASLYAGDGGDELFAGNTRYATQRLFDYYGRVPEWARTRLVEPVVFGLADRLRHPLAVKGKKYIQRAAIPYPQRLTSYGVYSIVPPDELFDERFLEQVGPDYRGSSAVASHYAAARAATTLDRQLYVDLKLAITDNDLLKVTRMTEAAGVTARYPFLDARFVELALRVPAAYKMRGRRLRTFFKYAYRDLLPGQTRAKKKHGFGLPIAIWLRTYPPLYQMLRELLLGRRAVDRGLFRPRVVEDLLERHRRDETSFYGTLLWNLLMVELWLRRAADHRMSEQRC